MDKPKAALPPPTIDDLRSFAWRKGSLEYKLWQQQLSIYKTIRGLPKEYQTIVMLCSRQYGKSFLGTLMAVEDCIRWQGYSVMVVGPTISQTIDIVHQGMRIIMQDMPKNFIRRSKSESRWNVGDSELIVGGFDTTTATRQRGKRALKLYIEEVVDSNPDQYITALRSDLGPMLTHSPEPQMIFLTTLPRVPDHPFIIETIPEAKLEGAFFKYTIDDNKQLTEDQYEACVRRSGGRNSIDFRREYLCEIVRDSSVVVVTDYEQRRHVKPCELPEHCKPQVTIDWGGVRDLTVAGVHTYDYLSDTDLIIDERVFAPNTPTDLIIGALREMEKDIGRPVEARYADVPGQLHVDLQQKGYATQMPVKVDWQAGINYVNMRFSTDKVIINPRCKFTIQSVESGTFNKNKTDFERTKQLGHCDGIAMLMYALRSQDRDNPWSRQKADFKQSLVQGYTPPTDEALVAQSVASTYNAATFGPKVYKPKRFGRF